MLKLVAFVYYCSLVSLLLSLRCNVVSGLLIPGASLEHTKLTYRADSALSFKKTGDDESSKPGGMIGWFSDWKSKLMNSVGVPVPDTANRYHIRIKDLNSLSGRHVSLLSRYISGLVTTLLDEFLRDVTSTSMNNCKFCRSLLA